LCKVAALGCGTNTGLSGYRSSRPSTSSAIDCKKAI
jgi:hypothetical protein